MWIHFPGRHPPVIDRFRRLQFIERSATRDASSWHVLNPSRLPHSGAMARRPDDRTIQLLGSRRPLTVAAARADTFCGH
jgi:hypothetical protein